jgi:hypothetical protein
MHGIRRAIVDKQLERERAEEARSGKASTVEMQFNLMRAEQERAMLEQATEAWLTAGSGGGGKKGAQLAVDASGRMVIGMSGRRMAHRMPAAIEVAIETLEGSLLVMRRANRPTVARCARRFQPLRSILTEIYLCRTCSCHEILRVETPGQGGRASHPSAGGAGAQRPEGEGEGAVHARCIDRSMRPRCDDRSGAGAVHALSPRHHRRHCRRRQRRGRGGAADACVRACVRACVCACGVSFVRGRGVQSDVLAAWLLDHLTTEPTSPALIASCIGIRNPEILRVLLRKVVSVDLEERRRALEVVAHLRIEQVSDRAESPTTLDRPGCPPFWGRADRPLHFGGLRRSW